MDIHNLVSGKYYHMKTQFGTDIALCDRGRKMKWYICMETRELGSHGEGSQFRDDINWDIREATQEEINHLKACVKARRYIKMPKLIDYEIY